MSAKKVLAISKTLSNKVNSLSFSEPVHYCYNPLDYAWKPFSRYINTYAGTTKEALFVGMNPGPFGMAQTGVPFGDIEHVRDWLAIEGPVGKPDKEHPKRPIEGFSCPRGEVSGKRLWGWAKERFREPEVFFNRFFVWNYCPLCFMGESGKNITPDKLLKEERESLFEVCDTALAKLIDVMTPEYVIGIGRFASDRAKAAEELSTVKVTLGTILHPSPASPAANRGWQQQAETQLQQLGIKL